VPGEAPADTQVQLDDTGDELRLTIPPMVTTRMGRLVFAVASVVSLVVLGIFTVVMWRDGGGADHSPVFLVFAWLPVLAVDAIVLGRLLVHRQIKLAPGVVEQRLVLGSLGRWKVLPLPAHPEVRLPAVPEGVPNQALGKAASFIPLMLKYEGGTFAFGYHLSADEKRWVAQSMNSFLRRQEADML
jgi:hypothetical protein